jgi:hypothetical protein
MSWAPTLEEVTERDRILSLIRQSIARGETIPYLRNGPYSGTAGEYRYVFEGEEDLLHLLIERRDSASLEGEETRPLARLLLEGVPEAMIWLKPGESAHHYYLGHDLLLAGGAIEPGPA